MHHYQKYLNDFFSEFRPEPNYPTYPPYHTGLYLEDYFYKEYNKENIEHIFYIPVSWTTTYIQNQDNNLQEKLNSLEKDKKYFIVCQHDDAPKENLPYDCLIFAAGGNIIKQNTIPIPLICSNIPSNLIVSNEPKKYLASFVGSITHQMRYEIYNKYANNEKFLVKAKQWTPTVTDNNLADFIKITQQSYFTFCPRGYGLNSFRLYESFQLGSVPIIVTDKPFLPMSELFDWNSAAIIINMSGLDNLEKSLIDIINTNYDSYITYGKKIYNQYFTLNKLYKYIMEKICEKNTTTSS